MLRFGCIERKEKKKTRGAGGPEGYCPFWVLCCDIDISVATGFL